MEELEHSREVEIAYEEEYRIEDPAFFEPFIVRKPVSTVGYAWWNGENGRGKVMKLFEAFKTDLTISEACISSGISYDQYKYFCRVHPEVSTVKQRCKAVLAIAAKRGLVADITHPEGYRSRQWYLERRQPGIYGRNIGKEDAPHVGEAGGVIRKVSEAFLDENGNVTMSREMAEFLRNNGDQNIPDTEK